MTLGRCIYQLTTEQRINNARIDDAIRELVTDMCSKTSDPIIISDFLEIKTLKASSIGLTIGELFRSHYSEQCEGKIVQVEFPKQFQLTRDGLIALTRNPEHIKNRQYNLSEAIVGTYSYNDNTLRIFVRKIDVDTGTIIKMKTREIALPNCPQ